MLSFGTSPSFPQVRLSDGTFYGTFYGGFNGDSDHGLVYKLRSNGSLTTLYQFQAATQEEANPTIPIAGADGIQVWRDRALPSVI
jgi:uncharacterized repeat protein (TIGR03803 family)